MRKMKAISSLELSKGRLKRNVRIGIFLLGIGSSVYGQLVTTQDMLPALVQATSLSEVETVLRTIVDSFTEAQQQVSDQKKILYQALAQDCLQYAHCLEVFMIDPKTGKCCSNLAVSQKTLRELGYSPMFIEVKKQRNIVFFDFYACCWRIYAYLFASIVCDAQVACDDADFKRLVREAKYYFKKLQSSFYFLEKSHYDAPYARLLTGYNLVFQQLNTRGRGMLL